MRPRIKIAPSLLSADFGHLAREVLAVEKAGADLIHFDVMDGHFVPNITVGPLLVGPIRKISRLPIDCHLMIENPRRFVEAFARAGADIISVHAEVHQSSSELKATLLSIKKLKKIPAVAINPVTPLQKIINVLENVGLVLLMTVNPGFGGQSFMKEVLPKIRELRRIIDRESLKIDLEVDGGINPETALLAREAGANVLVAGSAVFYSRNYARTIGMIRGIEQGGRKNGNQSR
jgi:ribulose-phosphate 3-epimerase